MSIKEFLGGTPALLIGAVLGGMALGGFVTNWWQKGQAASRYEQLAADGAKAMDEMAGANVTLIANAGRREMNLLWEREAERGQCRATIETFQKWETLSAEAKASASKSAAKLSAELASLSLKYQELLKSYESADKTTVGWLRQPIPADLCGVRYGPEACRADPFAAAGYPKPADRPEAVAQPSR